MALRLVIAIVLVASSAEARQGGADLRFAAWVKARAEQVGAGIESWGLVQLDDDAAPGRFAVVCASDGDKATVLVEKSSKQAATGTGAPQMSAPRRAALFRLDGASGSFRHHRGDAPTLSVTATPLGRRAQIAVTLSRAATAGDTVEVWTVAGSGQPMAWVASWGGTAWSLAGKGQAPQELPELTGDATHVAVPVVRRDLDEPSTGTPLCVSWRSPSPSDHVATCELDPKDRSSFGALYATQREALDDLRIEPR